MTECNCEARCAYECCCGAWDEPLQRTWVGLTEDEAEDIYRIVRPDVMKFWRLCEAKLKERNT